MYVVHREYYPIYDFKFKVQNIHYLSCSFSFTQKHYTSCIIRHTAKVYSRLSAIEFCLKMSIYQIVIIAF